MDRYVHEYLYTRVNAQDSVNVIYSASEYLLTF